MPIKISEEKPEIADFLNRNHVAVLSTADDDGQPHAATIYYFVDADMNIYFMTKEATRKYKNLKANPRAALAIYEASSQATVQIEGTASEITDSDHMNEIFKHVLAISNQTSQTAIPPVSRLDAGEYKCFRVTPKVY